MFYLKTLFGKSLYSVLVRIGRFPESRMDGHKDRFEDKHLVLKNLFWDLETSE